jgi:hypothetical protein
VGIRNGRTFLHEDLIELFAALFKTDPKGSGFFIVIAATFLEFPVHIFKIFDLLFHGLNNDVSLLDVFF